jgi:Outer membrane protein beta-barrel domain
MKKFIAFLTLSMCVIAVSAQVTFSQPTQRGNFVIGTRLGFSSAKSTVDVQSATGSIKGDGGSSYQLNIAPGIGYFIANNFVIGVGMDLIRTNSKSGVDLTGGTSTSQESNNNNVLFGPFIRYFIPFGDDKAFFIGSTVGFGNSKNQFTAGSTTQSINTSLLTIGVGPGFTIYSSNGLALEALVKYNFANSNSKIDVQGIQRTSKTWTNAIDFSVGVQYYFGGFRAATVTQ